MDDGGPQTLRELLAAPGVREQVRLRSTFGFMAIHGGELEQRTDLIARSAADLAAASYYVVSHPDGHDAHLASIRYRTEESAALAEFVDHVDVVVSVHGYGRRDRWTTLLLGGSNRRLARVLGAELARRLDGYEVVTDLEDIPRELRGMHPVNPVNRPSAGGVPSAIPVRPSVARRALASDRQLDASSGIGAAMTPAATSRSSAGSGVKTVSTAVDRPSRAATTSSRG